MEFLSKKEVFGAEPHYFGMPCVVFADGISELSVNPVRIMLYCAVVIWTKAVSIMLYCGIVCALRFCTGELLQRNEGKSQIDISVGLV